MISAGLKRDVFYKSFFVQAARNDERMQNVGFVYAIRRSLKSVWQDEPAQFEEACARASSFFNTHPYFAPAMMGVALHIEEKIAAGLALPEHLEAAKSRIAPPLNALGSLWFWENLKMLAFLLALPFLVLLHYPPVVIAGVALYFVSFNYFHLRTRWAGLNLGLLYGEDMVSDLLKFFPSRLLQSLRRACVFLLGIGTPLVLTVLIDHLEPPPLGLIGPFIQPAPVFPALLLSLAAMMGAMAILYYRWLSVYQLLVLAVGLAIGAALWL